MNPQGDTPAMQAVVTGSGEPLVLLPGGLTGWLSWIPHAETLSASRKVIRLQLLNVELGLSGAPLPANYSADFEAAALGKTLESLAIEQADLAGWSYGSLIALRFALQNPQRVRSLTLIEPSAYWILRSQGSLPSQLLAEQEYMQSLASGGVSEEKLAEFMHFIRLVPESADPRMQPQWVVWFEHRQSLRIGDIEYRHEERRELLHSFEKSVLLVKGAGSNPFVHDIAGALAEAFPDARVLTLPGGHAPHIESMQPFLEQFTRFLSEIRPRQGLSFD